MNVPQEGLGARVTVVTEHLNFIIEVEGGSSRASQNSSIFHFRLDKTKKMIL